MDPRDAMYAAKPAEAVIWSALERSLEYVGERVA
jgi:hypothetical protein